MNRWRPISASVFDAEPVDTARSLHPRVTYPPIRSRTRDRQAAEIAEQRRESPMLREQRDEPGKAPGSLRSAADEARFRCNEQGRAAAKDHGCRPARVSDLPLPAARPGPTRGCPRSAIPACDRFGRRQSAETRPADPCAVNGHPAELAARGLHLPDRPWPPILLARFARSPAPARLQGVDERHRHLF